MEKPEKSIIGAYFDGRSHPIWHYKEVPEGMRPARTTDLYYGRPVLYQVLIGPDKGDYYTDYVRNETYSIFVERINLGYPVYVKD